MALINLLYLNAADDQQTFVDKLNFDLDQLLSFNGGPIGPRGFPGIQGVPGAQGIQGFQGLAGKDGSRWFVSSSVTVPTFPTPKLGDFWLQSDTLDIYEYSGSPASWTSTGLNLASNGVFKSGGANNLMFTNPSELRSLVLSPINYGNGNDSPGTPNYRLKIVGTSGSPMLRYAISDGGIENSETFQPTTSVQKINDLAYPSSLNWRLNTGNLNGDIFFNLNGNFFGIYPQIASVSKFEFGTQLNIQNNAADRLLSFASSNTGSEFFHIGRHTGITTTSDRLFSVSDTGQIAIGDAFSTINQDGATTYKIDSLNSDLLMNGSNSPVNWMRWRGRTTSTGNFDALSINHNRTYSDAGPTANSTRSSNIRIQHYSNTTKKHFLSFNGGSDSTFNSERPQLRLGYVDSYYLAADINGRIGIGSSLFIMTHNDTVTNFLSKLTIEGNDSSSGGGSIVGANTFSGITLVPQNFNNSHVGVSSVGIFDNLRTYASMNFQDDTGTDLPGMSIHFGTGAYSNLGQYTRQTIWKTGDVFIWSKNVNQTTGDGTKTQYLSFEVGGKNFNAGSGNLLYPNNQAHVHSYDTAGGNSWKNIIFNAGTDTGGFGGGFVGVGMNRGFSETITGTGSAGQLVVGNWYVPITPTTYGITYPVGIPFQATAFLGTAIGSGNVVANANPMTKFHVNDSVTFGTRDIYPSGGYSTNVGYNSFTVGNKHKASSLRGVIIGGFGHTVTGTDGIIIGYNGSSSINMPDPNKVLLATTTHVSTVAPTTPVAPQYISSGDTTITATPKYRQSSVPILNLSTAVNVPSVPVPGELGDLARVLTLEGRSNLGLDNIPVALEFHVRNASAAKEVGMLSATYYTNSGNARGKMSLSLNINDNMYESVTFSESGMIFIPGMITPKIGVEKAKTPGANGALLGIQAGFGASSGNTTGGSLYLDAGIGNGSGLNGSINIGSGFYVPNAINIGNVSVPNVITKATKITDQATGDVAIIAGANASVTSTGSTTIEALANQAVTVKGKAKMMDGIVGPQYHVDTNTGSTGYFYGGVPFDFDAFFLISGFPSNVGQVIVTFKLYSPATGSQDVTRIVFHNGVGGNACVPVPAGFELGFSSSGTLMNYYMDVFYIRMGIHN